MHNDSDKRQAIHNGERIAQMVIMPYVSVNINSVKELSDTDRGQEDSEAQELNRKWSGYLCQTYRARVMIV